MDGGALPLHPTVAMASKKGLQHKLTRVFLLQAALVSVAIVLGIFISAQIFENVLVKKALEGEADHFWQRYEDNPLAARPDTLNLLGFLAVAGDFSEVPPGLRDLGPGYARVAMEGKEPLVYVEDKSSVRLFLVFDEEQVSGLAFYFGIVPLSIALIIIYLLSWLSYRLSRQAISPVVRLAEKVESFDLRNNRMSDLDLSEFRAIPDEEVAKLVEALDLFTERVEQFIDREQNFTRDASHELRTPLAVIKSSIDLLDKRTDRQASETRAIALIRQTTSDMESLIETLLLLSREESSSLPAEDILVNDLLNQVAYQVEHAQRNQDIRMTLEEKCLLSVHAPEKVLNILFSNLLRNAFAYTKQGDIVATIDESAVSIRDSGVGMEEEVLKNVYKPFFRAQTDTQGHGLGLSIVKRLCNRFGWTLKMISEPGKGTEVSVEFPDARPVGQRKNRV